jgi:hypothetical protein
MNKRKEPPGLKDIVYRKVGEMVRDVGLKWTCRLYSADFRGREPWLQEIESVEAENVLLRQKLSSLPLPIISRLINRSIIEDFTQIIALYNTNSGLSSMIRIKDREAHQRICENILKSVLFPCISKCNLSNVKSEFVEELLIKLMYFTPNTKTLILPEVQHLNYMQRLVQNIQILNHLEEFNFQVGCTTEIIVELAKCCPHLRNINVERSLLVDNNCVEHLLKLRHLRNLNVAGTSVFDNGYRDLLSGLSQLKDIVWFRSIDIVIRNVTRCLHSVTRFTGNITSGELLVWKCPNIHELSLIHIMEEVPDLGDLRRVHTLKIIGGICIFMNFTIVIERLGANLTTLSMYKILDLNINEIINSCSVLSSLYFSCCHVLQKEELDSSLPHFQNLRILKLKNIRGTFEFRSILHMYINLNEFHAADMEEVTETLIRQIVRAGGFRHLSKFIVYDCGHMSMNTAWALLENCPNLTELGKICTWPAAISEEIETFLNFVRNSNLSLTWLD